MAAHDHHHGHHHHGADANTRQLAIALALTSGFLLVEALGAWLFDSLALLSDAAHMLTDSAGLAIALAAVKLGRLPADSRRTFGYRRFEILAAAFNAVLLLQVAAFVLIEGVGRLIAPRPVESTGMLLVAFAGLIVNLIAMRVLASGAAHSINVKGAYLEVWADMLGSLGVIGAALAIRVTGANWIDPLTGIAIALWVVPRTWSLLRDTTHILLEGVPPEIDLDALRTAMTGCAGVINVHDLHIWSVTNHDSNLTAHVEIGAGSDPDTVRRAIAALLIENFNIGHVTLQLESEACADRDHLHA